LIYSKNLEDHAKHLHVVLQHLRDHHLYAKSLNVNSDLIPSNFWVIPSLRMVYLLTRVKFRK
jgi:hypothetical protein